MIQTLAICRYKSAGIAIVRQEDKKRIDYQHGPYDKSELREVIKMGNFEKIFDSAG